jgi:hypothetical protein
MAYAYVQRLDAWTQTLFSVNNPNRLDVWAVAPFLSVVIYIAMCICAASIVAIVSFLVAWSGACALWGVAFLVVMPISTNVCGTPLMKPSYACDYMVIFNGLGIVVWVTVLYEGFKLVAAIRKAAHLVAPLEG